MVSKIIWSQPARTDLHRIARYLAENRPGFAEHYCLDLIASVESVAQFPLRGKQLPGQPSPHVRELVLPPYRVIYEVFPEAKIVQVLRVWDARRGDPGFSQTSL